MALLKVLRSGQVTLPAAARKALALKEGDYLEAEVIEGTLVLKPVSVVDRETARQDLRAILATSKWGGPGPEPSEDELMEMAVEAVREVRREHDKSRS
jgi:AbrB family looped-hinge helix DNA binding protein